MDSSESSIPGDKESCSPSTPSAFSSPTSYTSRTPFVESRADLEKCDRHTAAGDPGQEGLKRSFTSGWRLLAVSRQWLTHQLRVEARRVAPVPESDRRPSSIAEVLFLWFSISCHVGLLPIGALGPLSGLRLAESVGAMVVGVWLGALCPAFCGTLGPKLGLRAVATARFSFGFYGAFLWSTFNIVVAGGFGMINIVIAGQILSAVSDYHLTVSAGCVLVSALSYLLCMGGLRRIHSFLKYYWMLSLVLLFVLLGQASSHARLDLYKPQRSMARAGQLLNLGAIGFSLAASWATFVADYVCEYVATTPPWRVFVPTYLGISLSNTVVVVVGAFLTNAALLGLEEPWSSIYSEHGLGGLIRATYHPHGWSKAALIMLTFSVVGNNVIVLYSSGVALQLFGGAWTAVPRRVWSLVVAIVLAVLSIAGKEHLSAIVSNFVSLLGYASVSFTVIILMEDRIFRRETGYDVQACDHPARLPTGLSAILALVTGYLCGGLQGMSQAWFVGPIARRFGPTGGDVGIYLTIVVTSVTYLITRRFERKTQGR